MQRRILQANLEGVGGAYSLVSSVQREVDEEYIFDYYCMGRFKDAENPEILKLGSKIYSQMTCSNRFISHILLPFRLAFVLSENGYPVIHIHVDTSWKALLYILPAWIVGVPCIVIHSHATNVNGDYRCIKKLVHYVFRLLLGSLPIIMVACSNEASRWMYPTGKLRNVRIINNGISIEKYRFSKESRIKIRKELGIDKKYVIGHVGDFTYTKNVSFLLDIIGRMGKSNKYSLLLVGDGKDKEKYEKEVSARGIQDNVIFYGKALRMNEIYSAMDIFLFPSISEAMPMCVLEAQVNGLPCILSGSISREIRVCSSTYFLNINNIEKWIMGIKKVEQEKIRGVKDLERDINIIETAKEFKAIYDCERL